MIGGSQQTKNEKDKEDSTMRYLKDLLTRQKAGFTLIELVVVIAILGILAAIAVPVITSYMGSSKERAYNADQNQIQTAVSAYYGKPDNTRYAGRRQYPILGVDKAGTDAPLDSVASASSTSFTVAENPAGGTQGGTPWWEDSDTDGVRDMTADDPLYHETGGDDSEDHWNTDTAVRGTGGNAKTYAIDSRDYFVDFDKLVTTGSDTLLKDIPDSVSNDNLGGWPAQDTDGSYSWYVDSAGKVKSLYAFFPESTETGYKDIYP
jgi:prepilin-type N-terminal cleavage/methylation domain-containing protein